MSILSLARTAALALACVCLTFGDAAGQTLSKPSLALGNVALGSTGAPKSVSLKNTTGAPLTITSISVSSGFVLAPGGTTCQVSPPTLANGASCSIAVAFAPTVVGPAN